MNVNNNVYLIILVVILSQFAWYYVTLPGSYLSPNKEHPNPSIKNAGISYLIYVIPMILAVYYLNPKQLKLIQ